jgi:hypothetical protein
LGLVGVGLLVNVMFGFVLYSYRRRGAVSRPSSHVVWPTDLGGLTRVLVGILGLMIVAGGNWQFATASSGSEYLMGAAVAMFGVVGAVAAFRGKSPSWLAEESIPTVNEPTRSRLNHHRN